MMPFTILILILLGLLLFHFRQGKTLYFEITLIGFLCVLMAAMWILSEHYAMVGRIDYPHFYWALLSFPLILFSRWRIVYIAWGLIFFTGFIYWYGERVNITFLYLVFYCIPLALGLCYLISQYFNLNEAKLKSLHALIILSVLLGIFSVTPLLTSIRYSQGYINSYYALFLFPANLIAMVFVMLSKHLTWKQKVLLSLAIICWTSILVFVYSGWILFLSLLLLISLLLFYRSIRFFYTENLFAVLCSLQLSAIIQFYYTPLFAPYNIVNLLWPISVFYFIYLGLRKIL